MTSKSQTAGDPVSEGIRITRVLCIFFVMFVHVWPGTGQFDASRGVSGWDLTYHVFTDILGRSSVPLLTIVSGWLVARTFRGWRELVSSRVRSLLVPLALWNAIMVAALLAYSQVGDAGWAQPQTALGWLNAVMALTAEPATVPLAFLRDLFVCVLLAPLILKALETRKPYMAGAVMAVALGWFLIAGPTWLLLRPMILVLFTLGIILATFRFDVGRSIVSPLWLGVAALVIGATFAVDIATLSGSQPVQGLAADLMDLGRRVAVAYTFWTVAVTLAGSRLGAKLSGLEPYIFFVFCSHVLVMKAMIPIGREVFGGYYSPLYPAYFFLQPVLSLVIGVAACWTLARAAPAILKPLNAGKLPPLPPAPPSGLETVVRAYLTRYGLPQAWKRELIAAAAHLEDREAIARAIHARSLELSR
jgi:surface polysaccharide O-acyltransferase-like enzyme